VASASVSKKNLGLGLVLGLTLSGLASLEKKWKRESLKKQKHGYAHKYR